MRASRDFVAKWWNQTTDVHVLSSPWVRRPLGGRLRILWVVLSLCLWAFGMYKDIIDQVFMLDEGSLALQLILMWYFWASSLWIFCQSSWESLSGSVLFALGGVLSFRILAFEDTVLRSADVWSFTSVLLLHCSLHPVAVLTNAIFSILLVGFRVVEGWEGWMDPIDNPLQIFSLVSGCILLVLFTLDFNKRVKIAVTIMDLTELAEGVDTRNLVHRTSAYVRICAAMAGVCYWIFWAWIIAIKQREYEHWRGYDLWDMWANHLPKCTIAAPVLGTACLPLLYFLRRSPLAVDILLAIFCCLPGVLSLADYVLAMRHPHHEYFWCMHSWTFSLRTFSHLQGLFALQTLLLADCHPLICAVSGLVFCTLSTFTMRKSLLSYFDTMSHVVLEVIRCHRFCCFLYCFQIVSHVFDYFPRKRALLAYNEHNDGSVQLAQLEISES